MSFAFNAAPFENNISFNSNNKIKSTTELEKKIKKRKKPVQKTQVVSIDDDENDMLENFEPIQRPELTNETNRNISNNAKNVSEEEINNEKDFSENPYLISEHIDLQINKDKEIAIPKEKSISDVERKLNYLIKIMEKEKSGNVQYLTEEIILYGFFGVFIIYVIDSFTRVGKYVR